jgi:hypothetical protein
MHLTPWVVLILLGTPRDTAGYPEGYGRADARPGEIARPLPRFWQLHGFTASLKLGADVQLQAARRLLPGRVAEQRISHVGIERNQIGSIEEIEDLSPAL